ncbi:MAG TPA: hypothetical protein VM124_02385 [Candidatus Limnocylindrales bacterium]|nr:hypothetical protein [Candidatus Limnocylindrales bacterium]
MREAIKDRVLPRVLGVAFMAAAALLSVVTVETITDNKPDGLVIQDFIHGDNSAPFTYADVLAGVAENVILIAGTAKAGKDLVLPRHNSPTAN